MHEGDDTLRTVNLFGNGATGRVNVNWSPKEVEDKETGEPMWITVRLDDPVYYVKDHLGSIRATLNTSGTTVFTQNTYPYGEIVPGQSYEQSGNGQQRYDFTGKERDIESGLNYFGARYYDSELGRWISIDPMADKYKGWSSYNYCLNNPIHKIDPNGMEVDDSEVKDNKAYQDYANSSLGKKRLAQFRKGGKYEHVKLKIKMAKLNGPNGTCKNDLKNNLIDIKINEVLSTNDTKQAKSYLELVDCIAHEVDHADLMLKKAAGKVDKWYLDAKTDKNNEDEDISLKHYVNPRINMLQQINKKYNFGKSDKELWNETTDFMGFNKKAYDIPIDPIKK